MATDISIPYPTLRIGEGTKHILEDLAFVGILSVVMFVGVYWLFKKFGLFSYNGLQIAEVEKVYTEFQKRYPPLSKVRGPNYFPGSKGYFERGIATSKDGSGYPLYYHYNYDNKGNADFQIYPLMFETWTTDPGIFNIGKFFTGEMIIP